MLIYMHTIHSFKLYFDINTLMRKKYPLNIMQQFRFVTYLGMNYTRSRLVDIVTLNPGLFSLLYIVEFQIELMFLYIS